MEIRMEKIGRSLEDIFMGGAAANELRLKYRKKNGYSQLLIEQAFQMPKYVIIITKQTFIENESEV
jgi:hypothetical protein